MYGILSSESMKIILQSKYCDNILILDDSISLVMKLDFLVIFENERSTIVFINNTNFFVRKSVFALSKSSK